jgi:hypothetical protein
MSAGAVVLVILLAAGCSPKTDSNPARPDAGTAASSETQIELTAAQAATGADAQVTIPERRQAVTVKIPPGVRDGMRLRLQGMGLPGPDGAPTDFFIRIRVK